MNRSSCSLYNKGHQPQTISRDTSICSPRPRSFIERARLVAERHIYMCYHIFGYLYGGLRRSFVGDDCRP